MKKILIFLCLFSAVRVFAVTKTWIGASGGTWSTGTNWSPVNAPTSLDDIVFNTSVSVIVDGAKSLNSLLITNNSTVVFQGNNTTTTITLNCASCISSIDAGSTLTVTGNVASNKCEVTLANSAIFNVNGTLNLGTATQTATQRLLPATGTVTTINGAINWVGSGSSVSGSSASNYLVNGIQEIKRNGGLFPVGTYATTARNIISGQTTSIATFTSSQTTTWGSIELNAPGNTITGTGGVCHFSSNAIIQDFKVIDDGSGNCTLTTSGSTARVLTVNGVLEIASGTTLNINSTTAAANATASGIELKGNLTNNGEITETGTASGSFVTFSGTAAQTFSSPGTATNDVNLKINNTAGVTCLTDINWSSGANAKVTLTAGNFNMGANTFYIQNGSTTSLVGGSLASHFIGKLRRVLTTAVAAYAFPVSDNAADLATVKIYPNVGGSDFTAKFVRPNPYDRNAVPAPIVNAGNYIWDITQNTGTGADLNFNYGSFQNGGVDPANVKGLHWNGASWDNNTGADAGGSSVDVLGVTSFSPFTLGNTTTPLPIILKSIAAWESNEANLIAWETAIEQNVRNFIIEKSDNSKDWKTLEMTVPNASQRYEIKDNLPFPTTYYRLKNTDNDGREQWSKVLSVQRKANKFEINSIFPNPTFQDLTVSFENIVQSDIQVQILDVLGKVVFTQNIISEKGFNTTLLNTSNLVTGSYFLNLNNGTSNVVKRFVKQ